MLTVILPQLTSQSPRAPVVHAAAVVGSIPDAVAQRIFDNALEQEEAACMRSNYWKFGLVLSINAVIMFLITYVMIDGLQHFHANINRAYMAILMVAPMALLMLWVMRSMYQDRKLNWILAGLFGVIMVGVFMLIRTQSPVGDEQFLRSMIPHHSGAILMCERSTITDQEIRRLCETIVQTQEDEIAQMEAILARLD